MDEQLVAFLRELIDTRNTQLERLVPDITSAAQSCVQTLTADNRILCWGSRDCHHIAALLQQQLLHHYRIERPSLPCILLASHSDDACRQLKALTRPGDLLLAFCSRENSESTRQILEIAAERNLTSLTIGDLRPEQLVNDSPNRSEDLAIFLDVGHKAQVLDSQLAIALSLAGLIDHLLFGSEL